MKNSANAKKLAKHTPKPAAKKVHVAVSPNSVLSAYAAAVKPKNPKGRKMSAGEKAILKDIDGIFRSVDWIANVGLTRAAVRLAKENGLYETFEVATRCLDALHDQIDGILGTLDRKVIEKDMPLPVVKAAKKTPMPAPVKIADVKAAKTAKAAAAAKKAHAAQAAAAAERNRRRKHAAK